MHTILGLRSRPHPTPLRTLWRHWPIHLLQLTWRRVADWTSHKKGKIVFYSYLHLMAYHRRNIRRIGVSNKKWTWYPSLRNIFLNTTPGDRWFSIGSLGIISPDSNGKSGNWTNKWNQQCPKMELETSELNICLRCGSRHCWHGVQNHMSCLASLLNTSRSLWA